VYFECVWLLYRRFFNCFSVICNKTFYKVYTLFSHTHLTTLSQLLAVGGVTLLMYFWPKIIKINRMCEQPSKEVSLLGPTCTCTNTTALLVIPDIFVTAQTALYHCTIASYHCTFCVSLHSILCPAIVGKKHAICRIVPFLVTLSDL